MQSCDADQIHKLKQSKIESERKYTDDLFDYKTLLELVLIADTKVTQSKRSSSHILGLMGEVGGFYEAIFMFIGLFASVVCQRLFQANIANSYYMKKLSRKEFDKKNAKNKSKKDSAD